MCDRNTQADIDNARRRGPDRRRFTLGAGGALLSVPLSLAFMGCAPGEISAQVSARDVAISTPDGRADAYFAYPSGRASAAVLIWPDILGLRPAFQMMAKRLAADGYAALVVNPYYRAAKAPLVEPGQVFQNPEVRERMIPLARSLSQDTNRMDAGAFADWLDAQEETDTSRGIGTSGYCMGGPMALVTAHERSGRFRAAASFHGANLTRDGSDSPHLLIPETQADYLFAIAENDHARDPESKRMLEGVVAASEREAEIEVYEGALHGWCPPDTQAHDPEAADKAWSRMLHLFGRRLS